MVRREQAAPLDLDKAMLDPGAVFATPEAVLGHESLTRDQKVEILRRWQYDASEVAVAEEEGMPSRNNEELLRRILVALEGLVGGVDAEAVSPTKQHGLLRAAVKPK